MRLKQRLIVLPDGTDIVTFIEHDGNPPDIGPTLADSPRQVVTIGHLEDRYLATHANGTIEANSLDTSSSTANCRRPRAKMMRTAERASPESIFETPC